MRKLIFLLIGLLLIASCAEKEDKTGSFKYSATMDKTDSISFSMLIDEYKYVQLETDSNCLIGEIQQLLLGNERIFPVTDDGIYCFDMKGKFLYAINSKGRGPGEFTSIRNVSLTNGKLYLYDNMQGRVSVYNSTTGNYEQELKIPDGTRNLFVVDNAMISFRTSDAPNILAKNDEKILVCEKDNPKKLINAYFPEARYDRLMVGQQTLAPDGLFFTDRYNCTCYKITPKEKIAYFKLDIPEDKRLSEREIARMVRENGLELDENSKKNAEMLHVCESENHITCSTGEGNHILLVYYDKKTSNSIVADRFAFQQPYQLIPYYFDTAYREYMCAAISSRDFALFRDSVVKYKLDESNTLDETSPEYEAQQTFCHAKVGNNPIIAFYKLKTIK